MTKSLKNVRHVIPGESKRLTELRAKSIKALKTWETAQKSRHRSRDRELLLKMNAAAALKDYANGIVDEDEQKEYIGTAQNMSGHTPAPVNERMVLQPRSQARRNNFSNHRELNDDRLFGGGRRKKTMKNKRRK